MKKTRSINRLNSVVLYLFSIILLQCVCAQADITNGLILHCSFDTDNGTNVVDASGTGNDGIAVGATWTNSGANGTSGAFSFDGTDDLIEIPDSTSLDISGSEITVTAWVKPAAIAGSVYRPIISKWADDSMGDNRSWDMSIAGNTSKIYPTWSGDGSGTRSFSGNTALSLDTWQHVAITIKNGDTSVYLDGVLNGSTTSGSFGSFYNNDRPTYIGSGTINMNVGQKYFNGLIDEVRVYDRALVSNEVYNVATSVVVTTTTTTTSTSTSTSTSTTTTTIPAVTNGLVLHFTFDSDDGTNVVDQSGFGNDGAVVGATWTADGASGGAFVFDGADDFIEIADSASLDIPGSELTVAAWVRPDLISGSAYRPIVSKWADDSMGDKRSWDFSLGGNRSNGLATWGDDGASSIRSLGGDNALDLDVWQHVAITIKNGDASVYLDGVLDSSTTNGSFGSFYNNDRPTYIGSGTINMNAGQKYFDGLIDEVRVYDKALTSNEVYNIASSFAVTTTTTTTTTTTIPPVAGDGKCYNDYDGDGVSDLCIFDTTSGAWYIYSLANGALVWGTQWGWADAKPVPGDYDGDGVWDLAVFDEDSGMWYIMSLTKGILSWGTQWGWPGSIAVPGDYDGDEKTDIALFDSESGGWYILSSSGDIVSWGIPWGWSGAVPVAGDYDGDGTDDLAVYDEDTGYWYILSLAGKVIAWGTQWGWPGAQTIPGDYDGDGIEDLAVYEHEGGSWYILSVEGDIVLWGAPWGWADAKPIPGDYDGDGSDDLAVYDEETGYWFILSMSGDIITWGLQWGWSGSEAVSIDDDGNNGHGNDDDHDDDSNPGNGNGNGNGNNDDDD